MKSAASSDRVVQLFSSNPKAHVPATVIVPAFSATASFTITTDKTPVRVKGLISATFLNGFPQSADIIVDSGPIKSLEIVPSTVIATETATGIITLYEPAPID